MTIFSWKTKEFGNLSQKSSAVFLNFWRQNRNLTGNCQHSCQNSTLLFRRDLLRKYKFSQKNPMNNSIQIFNGIFFVVFWFDNRKGVSVPKWMFWGTLRFFLKKRKVFEFFSALGWRVVILRRWISNRLSIIRFFCLEELFQGDCLVSEKKINSSVFSLKNWAEPFKKILPTSFRQKNISTVVTTGFHASRGTLCGFFPRKIINCENVFATSAEVRYVLSKFSGRFVKDALLRPDEFV